MIEEGNLITIDETGKIIEDPQEEDAFDRTANIIADAIEKIMGTDEERKREREREDQ